MNLTTHFLPATSTLDVMLGFYVCGWGRVSLLIGSSLRNIWWLKRGSKTTAFVEMWIWGFVEIPDGWDLALAGRFLIDYTALAPGPPATTRC